MDRRIIVLALSCLLLLSAAASAKRILFYEVGSGADYTIEQGYSKFKEELQSRGHDVASITQSGTLSKEKLEVYDILVMQDLRRQMEVEDISAIIWFVIQKGSGLWINGGDPNSANKLTIPFGTTMDTSVLKDITSPIPNAVDNSEFILSVFPSENEYRVIRQGASKIGFYKGNGLFLSGSAQCIVSGDQDTFSETGSFPSGSKPCVASASLFGNGLVFVSSDTDMLTDKNIGSYDNKLLGLNIIDWLSINRELPDPGNSTPELILTISSLNLENKRLTAQVEQLTGEKSFLETSVSSLSTELSDTSSELFDLQNQYVGPLTKTNWVLLIVGFCVLGAAFIISKRKEKSSPVDTTELGYELGEELGDLGDMEDLG